jgi:N-acetyl-anhydromuramyl-L-alanine amidase AmpD
MNSMKSLNILLLFGISFHTVFAQNQRDPKILFQQAALEFNVPLSILQSISFSETRWQHIEWPDGDTVNCAGMPHAYGIMALHNDYFFGRSLREAAALIGRSPEDLKHDPLLNIRGAAALLKERYETLPLPVGTARGSLESWQHAVASYPGIPKNDLSQQYALQVFERIEKGYHGYGINFAPSTVDLQHVKQTAQAIWNTSRLNDQHLSKVTGQPDYPLAQWTPAYPGHWYTEGNRKDFIVIHDMEGSYLGSIAYFQLQSTSASIHYDVNSKQDNSGDRPAGDITQQVEEQYWAWHAICLNKYSFGIEHEGYASSPAWFTPEMYKASAKLVQWLCDRWSIPKDRNHIIGHNEYQNPAWVNWSTANGYPTTFATCNSHTDPGANWDWDFLMQLVKSDSAPPRVISQPPAGRVQVYDKISVTFDQRMEPASTEAALKIKPAVAGTFSWSNINRTLSFTPVTSFPFDSSFSVTLDTSAHNYLNQKLDINGDGIGGEPYSFSFKTVQKDMIAPQIISTYPADNQTDISGTVEFIAEYSEPLDTATIAGSFELRDESNTILPLRIASSISGSGTTVTSVRAKSELPPLKNFTLIINQTAKDFGGNSIPSIKTLHFTTENTKVFNGTIVEALDALGSWWQPGVSGSTVGVKPNTTTFSIVTDPKKSGTGAGKITYEFSATAGGNVREYNSLKPSIEGGSLFGVWVYGDNSGNALELWFYPTSGYVAIAAGTLNWTGWKLVTVSTSSVAGTARTFAGFVIRQVSGAKTGGTVYFDALAVGNSVSGVSGEPPVNVPAQFSLAQNYPNPFNPSTVISYQSPVTTQIRLSVYDLLGREVAVLVNEMKSPGVYQVQWNASTLPSGLYIYRLDAGNFSATRKALFVK